MAAGGGNDLQRARHQVALDDINATEWRITLHHQIIPLPPVALDDISATEWRQLLLRKGVQRIEVALDDISATEWRTTIA